MFLRILFNVLKWYLRFFLSGPVPEDIVIQNFWNSSKSILSSSPTNSPALSMIALIASSGNFIISLKAYTASSSVIAQLLSESIIANVIAPLISMSEALLIAFSTFASFFFFNFHCFLHVPTLGTKKPANWTITGICSFGIGFFGSLVLFKNSSNSSDLTTPSPFSSI